MTSRCHDNHLSGSKQNRAAIRTPLLNCGFVLFTKQSRHIGLSIPKNEKNNGLWTPLLCSMQTFEAVRAILWRNLCVSRWSIPTVKGHKGHEHALLCSGM